jgi:hypothetical protein
VKRWLAPFIFTCVGGILNPNGISGWLFPATVGGNYAMPVAENESVFRLNGLALVVFIEVLFAVLLITTVLAWRKRATTDWGLVLFALAAGIMSLLFFRIYVFFAGVALVAICANIRATRRREMTSGLHWTLGLSGAVVTLMVLGTRSDQVGVGQRAGDEALAAFLRDNGVNGRLFNNYASGGYYIYHFPNQKVFIDSRPEAYSADFIRNQYLASLTDEPTWKRTADKYGIEVISFTQFNSNEGAFLIRRLQDPEWAAIRLGAAPVLVKRIPRFQEVIGRLSRQQ